MSTQLLKTSVVYFFYALSNTYYYYALQMRLQYLGQQYNARRCYTRPY